MKTIKKLKTQDKKNYLFYLINGEKYRAYEIGNLPAKFGTWNFNDKEGIGKWFNCMDIGTKHSGLTFVSENFFPKWYKNI